MLIQISFVPLHHVFHGIRFILRLVKRVKSFFNKEATVKLPLYFLL